MGIKKRLSILHINTHEDAGGAAKVSWRLAYAQRYAGHDSKMLVGEKTSNSEHTLSFPIERNRCLHTLCRQQGKLYYEFQGSHKLVSNELVRSADILHMHNLHGGYFNPFSLSAISHLKPTVWTLHDMQAITGRCAHSFDCQKWQTGCVRCPDLSIYPDVSVDLSAQLWRDKKLIYDNSYFHIVTPSQWLKDKVRKSILQNHPVELIYNGVDTNIFKPYDKKHARKKFGIPQDKLVIGAVAHGGALENHWKGGSYTRQVFNALTTKLFNYIFVNIGNRYRSEDPRIINIPHINDESELAQAYSAMDVFLYTPVADNCPLVVLEAMSCGIPMVTFNTGGVPELVRDNLDGYVTAYKNVPQLVQALEKMATQPQLRIEFGENARQQAISKFAHTSIAGQYENLYRKILLESKSSTKKVKFLPEREIPDIVCSQAFFMAENVKTALGAKQKQTVGKSNSKSIVNCGTGYSDIHFAAKLSAPKIAVVTPSFNQAPFLEECIDSVLSQKYPNLEYVIIDGGSTDGSLEIIKKYEKYLTYWQSKPDKGQYAAIDEGFRKTTGEIMAWLNSDDKYHPDSLFKVAYLFQKNPDVEWLTDRPTAWNEQGKLIDIGWLSLWSREKYLQPKLKYYIQQEGTFWKRTLWEKAGAKLVTGLDLAGDFELWTRFFRHAQLLTVDTLLGGFRHHPGQKTKLMKHKYVQEAEQVSEQEIALINKSGNTSFHPAPQARVLNEKEFREYKKHILSESESDEDHINIDDSPENGVALKQPAKCTIATSIAPKNFPRQAKAIESWIKLGFEVVSINCPEEIEALQPSFPEVNFIPAKRDGRNIFGKPVIFFDDFLEYFRQSDAEVCGIVNSDVLLIGDEGIIPFIKEKAKNFLVYGSRMDIDSLDDLDGEVYEDEFDFFFFPKSLIPSFPKSDFCIGMPWWDYWMALIPILEGFESKKLVSPFAYHLKHQCKWNLDHFGFLAKKFFSCLRKKIDDNFNMDADENAWALLGKVFLHHHHKYLREKGLSDKNKMSVGIILPVVLDFLKTKSPEISYPDSRPANLPKAFINRGKTAGQPQAECDVSIVLCTKDRAQLLDRMLTSLKDAVKNISSEIIVVEGNSSDNTPDILRKHRVKKIYSESECLGQGKHSWPQLYNFGFSKARGKWAMYASDDIIFSKGSITHALMLLKEQKDNVAGGIFFYKNVHPTNPQWSSYGIDFTYGAKLLMNYGLVRLDYFRKVGGLDEAYSFYCADTDLCFKLYEKGWQLIPLPESLIVHDNVLDLQKATSLSAADGDIQLLLKRWKHFVPVEIPEPRRLLWQEEIFEALRLPNNIERIDTGLESYWHGLAYFQRSLFQQAKQKFIQAIEGQCDYWQVHWLLANAAYQCGDMKLAKKSVASIIKLKPDFAEAKNLLEKLGRKAQRLSQSITTQRTNQPLKLVKY